MHTDDASLDRGLVVKAVAGAVTAEAAVVLLLFASAGTRDYWQGWAYAVLFALYLSVGTPYFLVKAPDMVRRRLAVGPAAEREKSQKIIQAINSLLACLLFVLPGLERRCGPLAVPPAASLAALALCLAGMALVVRVSLFNHYAAATVTVEEGQTVVSTGPYARVRHPMYAAVLLWFMATPAALGSLWGLAPAVLLAGMIVIRLLYEERYLRQHLPGYTEYCRHVRYRLVRHLF